MEIRTLSSKSSQENETREASSKPSAEQLQFTPEESLAYQLGLLGKVDLDLWNAKDPQVENIMRAIRIPCRLLSEPKDKEAVLRQITRGFARVGGDFFKIHVLFETLNRAGLTLTPRFDLVPLSELRDWERRGKPIFEFGIFHLALLGSNEEGTVVVKELNSIKAERAQRARERATNQ